MKKKVSAWLQQFNEHLEKRRQEFGELKKKPVKKTEKVHHEKHLPVQKVELDIPSNVVIKVLLIAMLCFAGLEILLELKSILIMVFIAALLTLGISPILSKIERRGIPRPLAILILYVVFLGVLTVFFIQLVPIIAKQLMGLAIDLKHLVSEPIAMPVWLAQFNIDTNSFSALLADNISTIAKNMQSLAGSTLDLVGSIFSGVINIIMTLTVLFFMFLERERIGASILKLFPVKNQAEVQQKTHSVQTKMAEWFRGQFILMVIVGLWVYVWMNVLHFTLGYEYAITVALLAALAELLPYVGPFITYLLVGLIGIEISWSAALVGLACVGLTQFLEGNFLVPIVMRKAVGISSVTVILALMIGGTLGFAAGGIGTAVVAMIFSIPIAATIGMFLSGTDK